MKKEVITKWEIKNVKEKDLEMALDTLYSIEKLHNICSQTTIDSTIEMSDKNMFGESIITIKVSTTTGYEHHDEYLQLVNTFDRIIELLNKILR